MSGAVNATANLAQGIHAQPDNLTLWVVARKGFARLSIGLATAKLGCTHRSVVDVGLRIGGDAFFVVDPHPTGVDETGRSAVPDLNII